ncbi:hypothetical protein PoB_002726800 [Plakobranchus ocellatus]|uniref:Uncharacterized protein n=1 Tax=Plakobranchus ocellatus TaxID=259542 RepID=A0AAV4A2B2_9GAST|nr:hypothetical protein PoB_002726800 [Plakobranchus ocellatus]
MAAEVPLLPRPRGKKAEKDSPAPSPQGAAETEVPAKRRAEKSKRQEAVNRFAPLAMDVEETISSIWGDSPPPAPRGPPPTLWNALPPPPNPNSLQNPAPRPRRRNPKVLRLPTPSPPRSM